MGTSSPNRSFYPELIQKQRFCLKMARRGIASVLLLLAALCACAECEQGSGHWSGWTPCNATCGGGQMHRYRNCDGTECEGGSTQTIPCNTQACPGSGYWSGWTPCTVTCGGGQMHRYRHCDGTECEGGSTQTIPCNTQVCPGHGQWSGWSRCTPLCESSCNAVRGTCRPDSTRCRYLGVRCGSSGVSCCITRSACTVRPFINRNYFVNKKPALVEDQFRSKMKVIKRFARRCRLKVNVTLSYLDSKAQTQSGMSPFIFKHHRIGHAIKFNLVCGSNVCDGPCMVAAYSDKKGTARCYKCFLNKVKAAGLWNPQEPESLHDNYYKNIDSGVQQLERILDLSCKNTNSH